MGDVAAGAAGALLLGGRSTAAASAPRCCLRRPCGRCRLLAVLAWRGTVTMAVLVLPAAASGVPTMAFELARSAWVAPSVTPGEQPRAQWAALRRRQPCGNAGFAFGGWLYQALGAALASRSTRELRGVGAVPARRAGGDAGSRSDTQDWRTLWAESAAGLKAIGERPALRALTVIEVFTALGVSLAGTSLMIFVARDLALPTGALGMVFALGALRSITGAALAPRLGRALGARLAMALGSGYWRSALRSCRWRRPGPWLDRADAAGCAANRWRRRPHGARRARPHARRGRCRQPSWRAPVPASAVRACSPH